MASCPEAIWFLRKASSGALPNAEHGASLLVVEVDEQGGDRLGAHAGAAIGVQGQGSGHDVVAGDGFGDELLGEPGAFTGSHHPADPSATLRAGDKTAEDVEDHVEVEFRSPD